MTATSRNSSMHHDDDWIGKAVKVVVSMLVSAGLIVWLLHKVDINRVISIIHEGVNYWFIAAMMVLTVLSHIIRGIRWGIQLRAVGIPRMTVTAESVSIFGAYALNIVFPFLGEAWRCLFVARRERIKLSTVVGTDLGDRVSDAVMIGLIIALTMAVAAGAMNRFLDHYAIGRIISDTLHNPWLWTAVIVLLTFAIIADRRWRNTRFVSGINLSINRIWQGFKILFHLPGLGAYLWLTIGIWVCYFLETYLVFFAFPFTRELITTPGTFYGLIPGLVVFVFGSCSMAVPSNGGLGPWNIAVMFALSLYGISDAEGTAFSLVYWSFQAAIQIASGIFSAIYIACTSRR